MRETRTPQNLETKKDTFVDAEQWGRVGVLTAGFQSPFYGQILEGIFNHLTPRKYQTLVQSNLRLCMREQLDKSTLTDLDCEGLILHASTLSDEKLGMLMEDHGKVVLLNRHLKQYANQCIYTDDVAGGKLAARCLIDHGHRRIGMISGPAHFHESVNRTAGFESELKSSHLRVAAHATGNFHEVSGADAIDELLDSRAGITAVFVQNDEMAFGVLTRCHKRGVRVPEDLSVIGYDGIAMCEFVTPKLTTIQQPLRLLGEQAAALLCNLLEGEAPESDNAFVHTPILAERESVAWPNGYRSQEVALTKREEECLTWTAGGKTSWEISVILGVSESTVTFHLRNVVTKLKASNRTHAVAKAMKLKLIFF